MNIEGRQLLEIRIKEATEALLKPLMPIIKEERITDIAVNADGSIWKTYVNGDSIEESRKFDNEKIETVAALLASKLSIDASQKSPDIGTSWNDPPLRMQILLPPVVKAPVMSIRKQAVSNITLNDLLDFKTITNEQYVLLKRLVAEHYNIVISGKTGSGKTSLANALIREIDKNERLLVIEDAQELDISCCKNHVQVLVDSDFYSAGRAVKAFQRMNPDRIIIGEVRDGAALDLLKAWNTGHRGGIGTIHANSAEAVSLRFETLIMEVSANPLPELIAESIDAIVHINKTNDGRKVESILLQHQLGGKI